MCYVLAQHEFIEKCLLPSVNNKDIVRGEYQKTPGEASDQTSVRLWNTPSPASMFPP